MIKKLLSGFLFVFLGLSSLIGQEVLYVDINAIGNNSGTSWENAYTDLSVAINIAKSGDQLWVAAGVYYPTMQPNYPVGSSDQRFNHFTLKNGVSIYGGFAGDESSIDQRDLTAYKTVISGDIDQNDIVGENGYITSYANVVGENSYKLFYFPEGSTIDTTAVLDGFVLAGAKAENSNYPYNGGAAMLCFEASPKIVNCEFYGNYAMHYGGAIFLQNSAMVLEHCSFVGNKAGQHGGAFYYTNSEVTVKNCEFDGNEGLYGGAISAYNNESVSIFENCKFQNNIALDNAGVMTTGSTPNVFKNCTFSNNQAPWGGALVLYTNSSSEIINCTFEGNKATSTHGGAIDAELDSKVNIYNSTFKGNEANVNGGAIYCKDGADLTAYNTLFTGNVNGSVMNDNASITNSGSAIYAYSSKVTLINNTIVANYSFDYTNGAPVNNWSSEMNIYNSVIWNNRGAVQVRFVGGATGEVNNSIVQGGYTGNGNIDKYPMFLGYLNPSTTPSTAGDFNLLGNSPANNKGINTKLPKDKWDLDNDGDTEEVISCDLNGNPRVFAGVVDLGCYEQQLNTKSGYAIGLWTGTNMKIGTSGIAMNGTDFTIELWYFMQAGMSDGVINIFGRTPVGADYGMRSPALMIYQNDRVHYGYGDGTAWREGNTEKVLNINQWNHMALTFNDATNTMKVFANGKFLQEISGFGDVCSTPISMLSSWETLHGVVDEFRIWKEERTEQELLDNKNKTLTGNEENLVLYYNFDQITNGTIEDLAGANNGIISEDGSGNLESGLWNSEAIAVPVLKNVTNVGIDGFTLNWLPVNEATEYYIDVALDADFNNLVVAGQPTNGATSYTVGGLSRGTVYYYKVTSNFGGYAYQYGHTVTKLRPPGNALDFDGSSYVDATDICKYDFTNEVTIECWVNKTGLDPFSGNPAIWSCNTTGGDNNYILFVDDVDNHVWLSSKDGAAYHNMHFNNTGILNSGWHHVAIVLKSDKTAHLLIDGVPSAYPSEPTYLDPLPYGTVFSLGQEFDGTSTSNLFIGQLDEFRIWNRALTQAEIQANKDKTLIGDEPNLVTYYNFDQQTGNLVADVAKGFDGEIIGNVNWVESTIGLQDFVVEASTQNTSGFTLTWNAVVGASNYKVEVADNVQFENAISSSMSGAITHDVLGLTQGTKYYFRAISDNNDTSMVNYTSTLMEVPGNALWLDGKDDYIEANQIVEQGNKSTATMECWAYVDPTETQGRFLAINTAAGGNKYLLSYQANEGYYLYLENGAVKTTIASNDFRRGQWVHLAVTMIENGITNFYLNGNLVGSASNGSTPLFSGDQISFGQEFDGTSKSDFLKGAIDEIRFWSTILTQAEIQANMHKKLNGKESNLLAYYDFDQSEGQFLSEKVNGLDGVINSLPLWNQSDAIITPIVESITNIATNTATILWSTINNASDYKIEVATDINFQNITQAISLTSNATTYALTGLETNTSYFVRVASQTSRWCAWSMVEEFSTLLVPPGNALTFDGVDGEVNIGNVMSGDWNYVTLEAWVKLSPEQINGYPRIIGNFGGDSGFSLNLWNETYIPYFEFWNSTGGGSWSEVKAPYSISDNVWHHLACTYDGADMKLYIDGEVVATKNNPGAVIVQSSQNTGIGNQNGGAPLNGTLDEIRIWNIARTQAELKEYAHKTLTGSESGLVSYFNLDKADGTTFKDEAGNFDGTMTGGVSWAESKALITPFTLAATAIDSTEFTANWEAIPNASKYILRVATDKLLTQPVEGMDSIELGNMLTYDISGLSKNTNYYYGVMSYTDRYSAWSSASKAVKTTGITNGDLAINLSGSDNCLDLAAVIPKVAGKSAGAVTAWFKAKEEGMLFMMSEYDYSDVNYNNNNAFWLSVGRAGMDRRSLVFEISRDGSIVQSMSVMNGDDTYIDDKWHHIAIITGDGNNRILLDGKEQEIFYYQNIGNKQTQEFSNISNAASFKVGKGSSIQVDELAFYKNPITNEEAIERAHNKLTGNEVGLIAYYNFDDRNTNDLVFGRNGLEVGTISYERANVTKIPFLNEPVQGVTLADLSWEVVSAATEYVIDVAKDKYFQNKIISNQSLAGNSFNLNKLDKNIKYYYHVKAKANGEWGEYSSTGEIFTLPGKSLILDGVEDYLTLNGINNYYSDEATIECWVKAGETTSYDAIWANNEASSNNNQYFLSYSSGDNKLRISSMRQSYVSNKFMDYYIPVENLVGSWHHIAVTIVKGGAVKVYIDGKEKTEGIYYYSDAPFESAVQVPIAGITHHLPPLVANYQFSIGQEWDGIDAPSDFFKGEIDEFRVWDIALTQDEIRANMNLSEPEGGTEHYIAHYTFDEIADGNTIYKDWAKYNNATIVNGATNTNSEGVIIPITLEATNPTLGAFDMHINNIASAQSFEIEVAYDETFVPPLALHENIGKAISYNVEGLCPGVKYFYRARAIYDENTISDWSASDTVWTVNDDAVIIDLSASQGDYSGNLKLSWKCDNSYLIDDFIIKRRVVGDNEFKYLYTLLNEKDLYQYIDSTAKPGTYYEYTVQGLSYCYNNDTKIDTSNIGFNIPTLNLSKEINDDTQEAYIRLDYEFHPDFLRNVEFVRNNIENGTSQTFSEIKDSLIYRDGVVELCTPYTYQLVAKTDDYGDVKSHTKAFTLEEDIFDAIDTLDASKGYFDNKITLNWKSYKQNIIDEYQVSRRKYANGSDWQVVKIIDKGTTQVWIDEDANAGEYYEYLIVGYGTCGETILRTDSVYSVGFRQPEGSIAGQITYEGGNPVFDVKLTVNYEDASTVAGNCLLFDGDDSLKINTINSFDFTQGKTVEMWLRPQNLDNAYVLYKNSGLIIDYISSGELSALSGAAMLTYNIKTDTEKVWEDDNWNHIAISADSDNLNLLVNGQKVATNAATTDLAFDTTLVANNYVGYIEELRVWNTALTDSVIDRYKGLMFGRDEEGIICNLRFDEMRGNYVFDHSRTDDEANKSHAAIYGATWSDAIPSLATLSLGAKTELNGNYTANGIWFKGSGDSYSITPSYGVHEFDPATRSMLISENSLVYSSQNFTDISAFIVTGNVKYFGANFPVQDVMLAVDGQICVTAEGVPVTTDSKGNFKIEVPIGEHFVSVQKLNHIFSEGYFPPKDENGDVTYSLFDNPVSGIQFVDSTFMTVAGRIVGGTIEGDKEIGFGKSNNNLGVSDFTVEATKKYPIDGVNNTLTVTTDVQTGEYEVKLFPEVYQFVIDATHNVGNSVYEFNSIDDLTVINLADPMLENTATDTATIEEIVGSETTYYDTVYQYKYHIKRNWVYRSTPSIEVLSQYNTPYFYDSTLYVQDANKDTVEFVLVNADGSNRLDYPVFTKGGFYTTNINVFEEYTNIDNSEIDRVPVQDGKVTVINGCATYPAPVDYTIENGQVLYDFIGGFPNPTQDNLNPELSYTKTFEVHSYTGNGGSMHSQWPVGNPFRAYVVGGIPTGQNFITQGPDQLDFILRDPPGSNSSSSFEEGFTVTNTASHSFDNSSSVNTSLEIDLGWEVTTFIGFGAGIINTNEQIANFDAGIGFESSYSGGHSSEQSTTFTQSYSTSDDPAYVGAMGDLFFGHSTNITYGVSNCINVIPVGTGEEDLGTDVDGFTLGLSKGLNLGLTYGTSFIYTQNHIENYLIPDLEMFYNKLLSEGNVDSANYYLQQADLWRKTLATNEYQKYSAIKLKNAFEENKNISFDAGAIYEESMESERTESNFSSFEFSVNSSVSTELGFEMFGMGSTWKMESEFSSSNSSETESSTTESKTVGFVLNDGDQGDYFSVDVLKDPYGNGPVFSTLGGQSACPYEDGTKVNYADYIGHLTPSDFNNEFQLNYPTMKIEVPVISAENAIVASVPDNEPAIFVLKLSNQSEVNADNWFTLKLDAASNPYGAKLKMDGAAIINGVSIMIPGGTTLTKTLELEKGQASVNDYENINLILHSQCQFDPTDDVADICDTVTITANFVPTCTNVEILNPSDNWLMNVEANDLMPVKIGGYNVNHGTFEKAAFQYKAESASSWNTVAMFFNDTTEYGVYAGEKYKIDGAEALFYDWDMSILQDKSYQIRAVTACFDGSVTESPAHTGILDGVRPQVFGTPSPADGILEPNDEIMITFNEPIEEGAVTYYNIDVQGVINGAEINHGTSVQLDGEGDYIETPEGIDIRNESYSIEFWLKKESDAKGVVLSQGINQDELLELSFVADSIKVKSGEITIAGVNNFDDGNWHHYAIVYNNNTSDASIYIDDQLVAEKTLSSANATGKVFIGKSAIDAPNYLAAKMHDIRIWRKALAFNDIIEQMNKSLAGNEFGLTANWPLDEAEGVMLLEKAHSRNAILIGTWLVEPSSTAYLFNGTDQALTFETGSIPINSEMDMTIELWFKGNTPTSTATLFSNGKADIDAYDPEKTININLTSGGFIEVVSGSQTLATTKSYADDLWHHIAYVVNRRGYASLFIDAEKVNNINVAGFGSMESVSAYIGALGYIDNSLVHQTSQYFKGSIDEVRIWNIARSQEQIGLYKNNRLSGAEIGLMAYFPFETYQEVMGVMLSTPTKDDQSIDLYSETGENHCGTATEFGANGYSNISPSIKRKRAMSNVNFDYVINNDKIIITPTDELAMIEQCILEITVQNIQDKHANKMASPVTWTAYIKKNQVVWSEDAFTFDKEIEENLSFTTKVVNKGGTQQNFMISNLPSWLTATPEMGSLDPDSEIEVEFNVSNGLNIGNYSEDIFLAGASGYDERLTLDLSVFKQAPDWVVDETAFSSTMNFIAQLQIKEIMSNDEFDMIGVFAGDECRGVCNLEYKENYDSYFAFLVVYGNTNGESLTYRVWDASEGKIYSDVSPIYNFEPNAFYGNMASPILFTAGEKLDNVIELNKGWTWISLSLDLENTSVSSVTSNLLLTDGDVIKHADLFSTYDAGFSNWFGSLSDFELGKSYRINVIEGGNLQYVGTEARASENPITLVHGWNRIGFVSSVNMTVNEALAGFEPQVNDIIKSQYQFAMYDGYEWVGSMDFMKPGKGYMYKSLNGSTVTFVYPENASQSTKSATNAKAVEASNVEDVNTYEYSMSIVAHIDGIKLKDGTRIGAYINNELRGVASVENQNDLKNYCFITVFGSATELNQEINFAILNEEENTNLHGFSQLTGNESDGDLQSPVELSINSDIEISAFTEDQVEIYPNPFNAKTSISCNLITESKLVIEIYNIVGEKLDVLVDETMKAGAHTFIWDGTFGDGSQVVSGIYFVNVQMGENVQTLRIVKE